MTSHPSVNGMYLGVCDQLAQPGDSRGSWLVRGRLTGSGGYVLPMTKSFAVLGRAQGRIISPGASSNGERWLSLHHYTFWVAYQPADRFWIFQAVVGGVLLALAVLRCAYGRSCGRSGGPDRPPITSVAWAGP